MIPFKVQFDKLTEAYIKCEIRPYNDCACFIGNLLGGNDWRHIRNPHFGLGKGTVITVSETHAVGMHNVVSAINFLVEKGDGMYTISDIVRMENNFLRIINEKTINTDTGVFGIHRLVTGHPNYENALFEAFSSTLDILKEIHERNGEKVDDFEFVKREVKETLQKC